ncbi:MAG: SDR family oxidoreductase, partial [Novosphingobium sp.]|nr:SDR family oxidoreductase [Novosphingobium sp.]
LNASTAGRNWQQSLTAHLETIKLSSQEEIRAFHEANPDALRDGYSSSKELLIVWTQQVAIPLAQERRIRINCIAPCPVDTAFMEETGKVLGQAFIDNYPYPLLGRMPTAEEMAWSLLMLSSPLNAAVTGATLFSDQGYAGGLLTGALQPAAYTPPK